MSIDKDSIIAGLESQVATLKQRLDEAEQSAKRDKSAAAQAQAGQRIAIAALAAGVLPEAISDVTARAISSGDWRESKGQLIRHAADGFPDLDSTGQPVTPARLISLLKSEAPHLFPDGQPSADSSAPAKPARAPADDLAGIANPWAGTGPNRQPNRTEQARIFRENPALAQRLAQAAGVPLMTTPSRRL